MRETRRLLLLMLFLGVSTFACEPRAEREIVYTMHPPTWFEDGWSYYEVSRNEQSALFGARFGMTLIDLAQGRADDARFYEGMEQITTALFHGEGQLARLGTRNGDRAWYLEDGDELVRSPVPSDALARWSPDGSAVAYARANDEGVYILTSGGVNRLGLDGAVTGLGWTPQGDDLYAMVWHENGLSSLVRVTLESREVKTISEDLDATNRFNAIGVAASGQHVFVALAGDDVPDPEARHLPGADRDMDIYRLDVATRRLAVVVETPGDDFYPIVVGERLYWTHNEMDDDVIVVPVAGGDARVVVEDAQIPYWSHDGRQVGFTVGAWRVADWGLNLDAAVVDVDPDGTAIGEAVPIVVGYHEDFTPAWSPDGRWIAYHSHRSPGPVSAYVSGGTTDDIYLRRPADPPDEEIRLTDFGWEVGMADWSPDGTKLVFDSWERGAPGVSKPWVATIDPATGQPVSIERLPLPPGFAGTLLAAWSPLGDEIAAVERIQGERQALWILDVDGGDARKLLEFEASTYGGVDWTPDGETLVYGASSDGRMQLFSIPRNGGQSHQLTTDAANLIQPQISPDGRWIAATRVHRSKELRRMSLQ